MNESNKNPKQNIDVPEGYFDNFEKRLMKRISEVKKSEKKKSKQDQKIIN